MRANTDGRLVIEMTTTLGRNVKAFLANCCPAQQRRLKEGQESGRWLVMSDSLAVEIFDGDTQHMFYK